MTVITDTISLGFIQAIKDVVKTRRKFLTKRRVYAVSVRREDALRELRKAKTS